MSMAREYSNGRGRFDGWRILKWQRASRWLKNTQMAASISMAGEYSDGCGYPDGWRILKCQRAFWWLENTQMAAGILMAGEYSDGCRHFDGQRILRWLRESRWRIFFDDRQESEIRNNPASDSGNFRKKCQNTSNMHRHMCTGTLPVINVSSDLPENSVKCYVRAYLGTAAVVRLVFNMIILVGGISKFCPQNTMILNMNLKRWPKLKSIESVTSRCNYCQQYVSLEKLSGQMIYLGLHVN